MVSIIVPSYDCINSLKTCITSVLQQSHSNFEVILVDDGSSDGSGELCDRLAAEDERIQVIHKPNGGVSSARNAGIDVATGEYIAFCDSDDYLEPDYFASLLQTAARFELGKPCRAPGIAENFGVLVRKGRGWFSV